MSAGHRLVAVLVAVLWGLNFLAIHQTVEVLPPLLSVVLRFGLIAIPTVLFVPRPQVRLRYLVGYGLGFGVAQFTFLYTALGLGMPAGLASLVLQSAAPFTVLLGAVLLRERPARRAWIGIGVAAVGMTLVGIARGGAAELVTFGLVLLGGLGWAFGNLASRQARPPTRCT